MTDKNQDRSTEQYKTIKDASKLVDVPAYVLRFWEKQFSQIKLHKEKERRYYLQQDIDLILLIKDLLYNKGYTLEGARNYLNASPTLEATSTQIKTAIEQLKAIKSLMHLEE